MRRTALAGWTRQRLRWWLAVFFLALALPTAVLVRQAYSQLKWESFHQYQVLAEELGARIDGRFIQLINQEEARTFADYSFLVVTGDPSASFVQRSPLAAFPVADDLPGLIGYFQVGADGALSTPLLPQPGTDPTDYGVTAEELRQRQALADSLGLILSENRLVRESGRAPTQPKLASTRTDRGAGAVTDESVDAYAPEAAEELASVSAASPQEEPVMNQAAFDRLNETSASIARKKAQSNDDALGRLEDLKLDYRFQQQAAPAPSEKTKAAPPPKITAENIARLEKRGLRKERSALPQPAAPEPMAAPAPIIVEATEGDAVQDALGTSVAELEVSPAGGGSAAQAMPPPRKTSKPDIRVFESEIDTFDFALLDSGHFVLFRKVWRDGQRLIQGALIEQEPLLRGVIETALRETALARMSDLVVAWQGRVLSVFSGQTSRNYLSTTEELEGAALYQTRLSTPLSDMELLFSVRHLPASPGGNIIHWLAAILAIVLCGGFALMYRLGVRQIELARQQQDFVSAVSHELKTPLTSIRMYGEMLREGWAPEEKKRTYYDYIHDESERLSRLITNVLQLARMTRNDLRLALEPHSGGELMDGVRSKIASQVERAGFDLRLDCTDPAAAARVEVDTDAFSQIVINLVDNAIKFSAKADRKAVDIDCRLERDSLVISIRDYGPGVPRDQMKKIFRLFYRSENELTRETLGTGIGLALVSQLAQAMNGRVDVINREPGAEFSLRLPITKV